MRVPSNDVTESSRADAAGANIEATAAATITDTAQRMDLRIITFPLARNELVSGSKEAIRSACPADAAAGRWRGNTRSAPPLEPLVY